MTDLPEQPKFTERPTSEEKIKSWQIFNHIAPTYDVINRILSARQDVLWRKKLANFLPLKKDIELLDLATGTADQILHLFNKLKKNNQVQITRAIGVDLSEGMLKIGREKVIQKGLQDKVQLVHADATQLPFEANSFDVITMSFGIRNVPNTLACLSEIYRCLRPGGKVLILEFSIPSNKLFKTPYLFYFRNVLPQIGGALSGHTHYYKYLNNTAEQFAYGSEFLELMKKAGFETPQAHEVTFGIASIYEATKGQPTS